MKLQRAQALLFAATVVAGYAGTASFHVLVPVLG
jgi:hypothetical protein